MGRDAGQSQQVFLELGFISFSCPVQGFAMAATATDFAALVNPAASDAVLLLTEVWVNGVATSATVSDVFLFKRTALNTGGTTAAITTTCYDTLDDTVADAAPVTYSVNATGLGAGSLLRQSHLVLAATSTPAIPQTQVDWFFDAGATKMPRIRPGELVALSWNGAAVPTGTLLDFGFEWIEVPQFHDYVRSA